MIGRCPSMALAFALLALPTVSSAEDPADDARAVLDQARALVEAVRAIEGRYRGLGDFRIDVHQRFVSPTFGAQEESRGTLRVASGGRLRIDFDEPAGDWAIFDGDAWWWASVEDREVVHRPRGEGEIEPLTDLVGGRLDLLSLFAARPAESLPVDDGRAVLELVPRDPRDDIERVLIEYERSTRDVRRIDVEDPLGGRMVWRLGPPVPEKALDDSLFTPEIPEDFFLVEG